MVIKDDLRIVYDGPDLNKLGYNYEEYLDEGEYFFVENIETGYRYSKEPQNLLTSIRQMGYICSNTKENC